MRIVHVYQNDEYVDYRVVHRPGVLRCVWFVLTVPVRWAWRAVRYGPGLWRSSRRVGFSRRDCVLLLLAPGADVTARAIDRTRARFFAAARGRGYVVEGKRAQRR